MFKTKYLYFLLIALLGACSTSPKGPDWQGRSWQEGGSLYFSGISSETESIQNARQEAYNNALSDIADYLGLNLNVTSESSTYSQYSDYQSVLKAETDDVLLKQIHVKNFEYQKIGNRYVGNILLEYNQKNMKEEIARLEEVRKKLEMEKPLREQEEQKARQRRAAMGKVQVNLSPIILTFRSQLISRLQSMGYDVVPVGKSLLVNASNISYEQTNGIWVCLMDFEVVFRNQVSVYSARGTGATKEQAFANANKDAALRFPTDFY